MHACSAVRNNMHAADCLLESCSEGCIANRRRTKSDAPHICSRPVDSNPRSSQGCYCSPNAEAHTHDSPGSHMP